MAIAAIWLLAACRSMGATTTPAAATPAATPSPPPATRAIPTPAPVTLVPPAALSPLPTLSATPTAVPVNLAKWQIFEGPGKAFSFRYPPDWAGRTYTSAITRTVRPLSVDLAWLRGPSSPNTGTGPEFVLLFNWPSLDPTLPVTNTSAWSSVAGLSKLFLYANCATTFDSPAPVTIAGEQTLGAKFVAQCDRLYAGYMTGVVHNGLNYGLVVDVPAEEWDAWRPTFETMLASFAFSR